MAVEPEIRSCQLGSRTRKPNQITAVTLVSKMTTFARTSRYLRLSSITSCASSWPAIVMHCLLSD